jgi:2-iminobutanoate/2-iminopropanoate deaminase
MKKIVHTPSAPKALGPYSQAVVANGMVYCSGQIGLVPSTGVMAGDSVEEQTHQVLKNLKNVLEAAGSSMENVVKVTIFLHEMHDFKAVNEIYGTYFVANHPARETVAVKTLPAGAKIEISCIAVV